MRYFLFLIFTCPIYLTAQSLIQLNCIDEEKRICICPKGGDFSLEDALAIVTADTMQDFQLLACYHHKIGTKFHKKESEKALYHYNKSLKLREQYDRTNLWKSYYVISDIYYRSHDFNKSIDNYKIAYRLEGYKTPSDSVNILVNLADNLASIGELQAAVEYGKLATKVKADSAKTAHANNILGIILWRYGNNIIKLKQAIHHFEIAINLYKSDVKKARVYNNIGLCYDYLGNYPEAFFLYKKALRIYIYEKDTLSQSQTLNNIAAVLYKQSKYEQAIEILNQSLQLRQTYYENTSFQYTYTANYENLAENYEALGNINEALKNYQLALINLTDNFRDENDINSNPEVANNHYIYNKPDLLRILDLKAQAALKAKKIDLAHSTYQVLDEWINEFYKDLSTNASKLTWIERAHAMYGNAIEVALMKDKQEKAFEYAEKAHAVLLWQSLSQQAARSLLSEDDKEKMDDLNAQIRQADQQYRYGEIKIEKLRDIESKRDKLEQEFEKVYPEYKKRKYRKASVTVSDVQSTLNRKTAFIEYYLTDDSLYIFTITKKGLNINTVPNEGLAKDIKSVVVMMKDKYSNISSYNESAHQLYQKLIPEHIQNNHIKHLIIVPDKEIGTLPFAALPTQEASDTFDTDYPFLIKKFSTNYLYSYGSYQQLQQDTRQYPDSNKLAVIAPIKYNFKNWKPLEETENQANILKQMYGKSIKILKSKVATKETATAILEQGYETIQLSTHAKHDGNGKIIFRDDSLTQNEIDKLNVKVNRLILAACQTAEGKQNSGEGILSLGWNFAYKGVPSITMTQWSVNEKTTMDIMTDYHKALRNKTPADQALQKAQKQHLENVLISAHYHPYYWSAIIHTGNPGNTSGNRLWLWALGIILLLITFYILNKIK